uniref:Uncharacterized protein n=1 Tax=Anguilla anguilla TaxID=7936 RepID=A0A0E9T4W7_ANGAN
MFMKYKHYKMACSVHFFPQRHILFSNQETGKQSAVICLAMYLLYLPNWCLQYTKCFLHILTSNPE